MQEDLSGPTTQGKIAAQINERFAPRADQVGAVVAVQGQPLAMEVFNTPRLVRDALGDLLKGIAFDVDLASPFPATQDTIKHFIREVRRTPFEAKGSLEETYRLSGATDAISIHGTWLNPGECLHLLAINHSHPILQGAAV